VLLGANAHIGDGLEPIADGFGQYVRLLGEASALADDAERPSDGPATGEPTGAWRNLRRAPMARWFGHPPTVVREVIVTMTFRRDQERTRATRRATWPY
jgi:hypothetical protein